MGEPTLGYRLYTAGSGEERRDQPNAHRMFRCMRGHDYGPDPACNGCYETLSAVHLHVYINDGNPFSACSEGCAIIQIERGGSGNDG